MPLRSARAAAGTCVANHGGRAGHAGRNPVAVPAVDGVRLNRRSPLHLDAARSPGLVQLRGKFMLRRLLPLRLAAPVRRVVPGSCWPLQHCFQPAHRLLPADSRPISRLRVRVLPGSPKEKAQGSRPTGTQLASGKTEASFVRNPLLSFHASKLGGIPSLAACLSKTA